MLHARDPDFLAINDVVIALLHGHCLDLRRVSAGRRLGDAHRLQAQLAARDLREVVRFCWSEPWRTSVPMLYICP